MRRSPFGGSWSPNGVILFSPNWDALQRIPSAGGKATTATDAVVGNDQCCPWFLPDGEHYLFAAQTRAGATRVNLLVGSLSSTATKVVSEAVNAAYAQGRLLYLKASTLVAQPFDVKALRTTGEPEAVAERVGHNEGPFQVGFFTVSSRGMLAYYEGSGSDGQQLTWFDRTGKTLGTIGAPRGFFDIEASPDWKHLAASVADGENIDVWRYDLGRGVPTRFTFDPAAEFRAVWSPDGRSIVFNSTRNGHNDLYRKSADGAGAEELLYADTRGKYPVSWSRDGKFLLYSSGGGPQDTDLRVLTLTPERPGASLKSQPFLTTNNKFGHFSPDGRWVAYESTESQPSEIYVAPFSKPTEKHQISPHGGARPRWRQDGKEIFYLAHNGQLTAAEVTIRGDTVEVGAVRELFGGIPLGAGYFYDVSGDGQRILAAVQASRKASPEPITLVQNWTTALKR